MTPSAHLSFASRPALFDWLAGNHASANELWVRIFRKHGTEPSVLWEDCVLAALCWGWIDGTKRAFDDQSYLQRLTPRRKGSNWSQKNRQHAERLIAEGLMQPAGLIEVEAARADGRWDRAYAGQADMVFPPDFLSQLDKNPDAAAFFAGLSRTNLYSIYYRLQTAKRPETLARRQRELIAMLARGETFH